MTSEYLKTYARRDVCAGAASMVVALAVLPPHAFAAKPKESLLQSGRVKEIIDGDTLLLADGAQVRLVGIQAPKIAVSRQKSAPEKFVDWPFGQEAYIALDRLCKGKPVILRYDGTPKDRYGRLLAHVFLKTDDKQGLWLQQTMLKLGLARVYTFADNHARSELLLAAERSARRERLGLWAHPSYAIRQAQDVEKLGRLIGRFELVQGKVQKTAEMGRRIYINFGEDYRRDFTVTIEARNRRLFKKSFDPLQLANRIIRVRDWLRWINGPSMEATHPQQIEIIS